MKYNDNGEYKDIYVKAFDTLPVGAEVNMPDGSTVPSGWTEVADTNKWKFLKSETGTTSISLTNVNYKELYVRVILKTSSSDGGISEEFYVIKDILSSTLVQFRKGYYETSSANGGAYINVDNVSVTLSYAIRNGTAVTNYSTIEVYYR